MSDRSEFPTERRTKYHYWGAMLTALLLLIGGWLTVESLGILMMEDQTVHTLQGEQLTRQIGTFYLMVGLSLLIPAVVFGRRYYQTVKDLLGVDLRMSEYK